MGTCLSKKATNSSSPTALPDPPAQTILNNTPHLPDKKIPTIKHQEIKKREIFVIKHRKSHEIERPKEEEKEDKPASDYKEVDAILIQCGRLSRSSSTGRVGTCENPNFFRSGRRVSGSKKSYDFDQEIGGNDDSGGGCDEIVAAAEEERIHRYRNRRRESRVSSPSSSRRRTPSRERDECGNCQGRSDSRERGSGSGGSRRVSKSPARRSESPIANSNGGNSYSCNVNRPGKMVSVPATVSLPIEECHNGGGGEAVMGGVRRILVKRNVGESPRNRSPARVSGRVLNENQTQEQTQQRQPLPLSRSNSRKAEVSPFRRNPLGDIDNNVAGNDQTNLPTNKAALQKPNDEKMSSNKVIDNKTSNNRDYRTYEEHIEEETRGELKSGNLVPAVPENIKVQAFMRSRSLRRSRDFDIKLEALLNPNTSYTSLLLEDIQNFHQKGGGTGTPQPAFALPQCLTKACSILDAVADLNSTTSSNFSSEDRRKKFSKNNDMEEPEMEVMEEQESSGSNSLVGSKHVNWLNPSFSWEPTLADDSPDCWSSSRSKSNIRENGIGRGRLGSGRSALSMPNAASAST